MSRFTPKIKITAMPLPAIMFGIVDDRGNYELEEADPEYYILLFQTHDLAQTHIDEMNKDFWVQPKTGEKVFWYKNRENKPVIVHTKLKRLTSKEKI